MRVMLLFLKAYQPGLFDQQVTVSGHATKKGTYVQPYQAKRKKRLKDVVEGDMFDEAPQWDFASSKDWVEEERAKKREKTTKRDIELAKKKAEIARRAEGKATGLFSESDAPTPPKPPKPKKEPTPEQEKRQAEKKAEKEEDKAMAAAYRKAKEIAGKAGEMSARGALGEQDSKAIGTLAHGGDIYRVSLVRNRGTGMVSVAITPKGEKRATITSVRGDQTLAHAMGALLAAVKPDAVLTLDDQDAIAAQKATAQQARQQKEADAAMKAMRKYRAALGGSADPQPWDETDLKLHAKIAKTESYKYKSAHNERSLEINKARLKSDPSQWEAGHGVAWKVGRDQTNHGFRIKRIDTAAKMALITQVADTGLTTSGGNDDRLKDEWVDIADLRRERKYDATHTTKSFPMLRLFAKAATIAEPADDLIREHARLVKVLRSPSHADDLKEADEQEQELKEYRKKRKKRKKLNKALLIAPLTALLKARAHG